MRRHSARKMQFSVFLLTWLMMAGVLYSAGNETAKVETATKVLRQIMEIPEKEIPPALLQDAYGLAVIPDVIKAGLMVGGRHGKGILVVRNTHGSWSGPIFLTLSGGSVGWQVGVQSSDIVLVFRDKSSVDQVLEEQFTLGADAAVAAGPVGRQLGASTDARFKAAIYSYSRSKGLFLGVSLEGAMLQLDQTADESFYNQPGITPKAIFAGKVSDIPGSAQVFIETLTRYAEKAGSEKRP